MKIPVILTGLSIFSTIQSPAALTDGWTEIFPNYHVQSPWNLPTSDRFTANNGTYTCWVYGTDQPFKQGNTTGPRTEMRWDTWANQNTGNQFEADAMFDPGTSHTCIHQIKSDTGGEAIYLQVNEAGTLRNGTGADFVSGIAGTWFHINSMFNPAGGLKRLYYNGSLVVNSTSGSSSRDWYFKNGVYDNGMPSNARAWSQWKNIKQWVQTSSGGGCSPTPIVPYLEVNGGSWQQTDTATITSGQSVTFGPQPTTGGSWSWSGPNGFSSTSRQVTANNITSSGNYTATYVNSCGDSSSDTFAITVSGGGSFTGNYQIQNVASGLSLNVAGNSTSNGGAIIQWGYSGAANELWTFIPTSGGYYQINSVLSGKDAVVQGASTANGAMIIQWSFGSAGNDQWKPVQNSDGSYTFYNLHSGQVLDNPASSMSQGTQMDQWGNNNGANQHWRLISH
ncbi:MAG: RICIN domain-containing protein [Verrucomicrobia bacterium]|nr:RICIN domain-containing protein [Verrucomicrobiota bacterium]MDE3099465.1 RICIN domain-containing protein [Verrucomicrobiota bacterium]